LRSLLGREDLDTLLAHREDLNERLREQIALVVFPLPLDIVGPFLNSMTRSGAAPAMTNGASPAHATP
jgi:hypothetical protein